jgi:hypothetical protein
MNLASAVPAPGPVRGRMRAGAESLSACVQITPTDPFIPAS